MKTWLVPACLVVIAILVFFAIALVEKKPIAWMNPASVPSDSLSHYSYPSMLVAQQPSVNLNLENAEESRDLKRISDLSTLQAEIGLYIQDTAHPDICVNTRTIYASAPIVAPSGWVDGGSMGNTKTDGTGWLPVDIATIASPAPMARLPVDPVNNGSEHLVYLYACDPVAGTYELDAVMESIKYGRAGAYDAVATDGGNDPNAYELGTDKTLIPDNFWAQQ